MKKITRIGALALAAALCAAMLAGCGGQAETPPRTVSGEDIGVEIGGPPEGGAADGETLIFNLTAVKTIDPSLNNTVDGYIVLCNMYEGLYRLDDNDQPVLGAAESADVSDDGLTYTFHLRQDAKWSDGQPVAAGDFEYAWKRGLNPETAAEYAYLLYYVKNGERYNLGECEAGEVGVKALDGLTLQVDLENPASFFPALTAMPLFYPQREDVVSADPNRWTFTAGTFLSNGMYRIVENNDKVNYVLTRNEHYWNSGAVKLANIDIRQVEDENAAYASFKAGEFDGVYNVPRVEVRPGVEDGVVTIFPWAGTYFVCVNLDEEKAANVNPDAAKALQDVRVREALSLAIDRTRITEFIRQDGSEPAYAFVPPATKDSRGESFAATEYFPPEGDPESARQLLADAGFPGGEGFPALMYRYNSDAGHDAPAEALQGMWKDVLNIDVELASSEWASFQTLRDNHNYILSRHGWIADYNDASTFLEMWLSTSGQNSAGYINPRYDRALNNAKAETDPAKRDAYLHEAEDMLMGDLPVIPIFFYTKPIGVAPYVTGLRASTTAAVYFDQVEINR